MSTEDSSHIERPEECVICLEEFTVDDKPLSPCGHWVHEECIVKWGKPICPLCRGRLNIDESLFPSRNSSSFWTEDFNNFLEESWDLERETRLELSLDDVYMPSPNETWSDPRSELDIDSQYSHYNNRLFPPLASLFPRHNGVWMSYAALPSRNDAILGNYWEVTIPRYGDLPARINPLNRIVFDLPPEPPSPEPPSPEQIDAIAYTEVINYHLRNRSFNPKPTPKPSPRKTRRRSRHRRNKQQNTTFRPKISGRRRGSSRR